MAQLVITGGGIVGLSTAMLLAQDGHQVTVLERDGAEPPATPDEAWEDWERQGVNQFRMLHFFLPRFRSLIERELPGLLDQVVAVGGRRSNPVLEAPAEVTGGVQPGDEDFSAVTGRRPVVESVFARAAASTPGVEVRRGVAVSGLLTGPSAIPGVPHVTGVRTESGEELAADVVIDMTGRRSPLPRWLGEIGAAAPAEEAEDSGFIYYGRHFRSEDGSLPMAFGPYLQHYGSVSLLGLPADNGTWGFGIITAAKDPVLRALRDVDTWMRTVRAFPLMAHWVDAAPLDTEVAVMAKIEDRVRHFVVDGRPVATGVLAVADSWACTNPSLGRGMSIGLIHAVALRDLLHTDVLADPAKLALAWDEATSREVLPYYRATNFFDRHRLAEIDAAIDGAPYEPGDEVWELIKALDVAAGRDPAVLRASIKIASLLQNAPDVLGEPGMAERVMELGGDWRECEAPGPNREQLLAVVSGA